MRGIFLFCLVLTINGCAHAPLRRNTLRQAQTLSNVYEQQVLDNIALAIAAPESTPYFAIPKGGSTQVTQSGTSTVGLTWSPRTLLTETLNINGTGSLTENWSLEPVTNPDRLDLMSCLLLYVTCRDSSHCQGCNEKLAFFFKDKFPECIPTCFFGFGKRSEVPKHCSKVGRYGQTYVWVAPGRYADLQAITLAMLDIVTADLKDFSPPNTKTVKVKQRFIGANGAELEGEFNVTPSEYNDMLEGVKKLQTNKSADDKLDISPDIISPSMSIEVAPMFRQRRETNDGPSQSLLLLPRQ